MLDTVAFTESVLRGLVGICSFLSQAIQLLRSFHINGVICRLMSLSIIRCSALDMSLELCHELRKGHVLFLFFLSCFAHLYSLNLDLINNIERSTIVPLKISASEHVKGAIFLGWSEKAVSNMTDYVFSLHFMQVTSDLLA